MNEQADNRYLILPFNFQRQKKDRVLLVNMVGEYLFLDKPDFDKFLKHDLHLGSDVFLDLKSKHFLAYNLSDSAIDLLAVKYRTKKSHLFHFSVLHMLEITLRCNLKCTYCQVSSTNISHQDYDMSTETADRALNIIMQMPAEQLKIEFQGGEPLLNFKTLRHIIEQGNEQARLKNKVLEFVICTNLIAVTNEMLDYLKDKNVFISTSLDGPKHVHDASRLYGDERGSYEDVIRQIEKTRSVLGQDRVSALMTVSKYSLDYPEDIVNEYVKQGFSNIFIRPLNPFGRAAKSDSLLNYGPKEFVAFYKKILQYIIEFNLQGIYLEEVFASILLRRILTPFSEAFVDLQFPPGVGILGVVYGYDGKVYASDEGRMLGRIGDDTFCMGNLHADTYSNLFNNEKLRQLVDSCCVEGLTGCFQCVFSAYCGIDPVRNYVAQSDPVGHRPTNDSCFIIKEIFDHLFEMISDDPGGYMDVFWSWLTRSSLAEIRMDTAL